MFLKKVNYKLPTNAGSTIHVGSRELYVLYTVLTVNIEGSEK